MQDLISQSSKKSSNYYWKKVSSLKAYSVTSDAQQIVNAKFETKIAMQYKFIKCGLALKTLILLSSV